MYQFLRSSTTFILHKFSSELWPHYRVVYLVVFYLRPPSAKWKQFLVLDIKWVYFFGQPYENLDPPMTFPIEKEQPMQILGRIVPMVWLLSSNRQRERGREDIYISRFQRRYFLQTSMLLRQEKKVYSSRKRNTLDTIFGHKWKKSTNDPICNPSPGKREKLHYNQAYSLTYLLTFGFLLQFSSNSFFDLSKKSWTEMKCKKRIGLVFTLTRLGFFHFSSNSSLAVSRNSLTARVVWKDKGKRC